MKLSTSRPYGIRGIIWYQGERNSKNVPQAFHYRKQLTLLVNDYRSSWHQLSNGNVAADFPFQLTQLPSWGRPQTKPVEGLEAPWTVNREAMRLVTSDVINTGMVVSIDTGDAVALHPKNKKPLGIRHALLALKRTYGRDIVECGPRFRKQTVDGNRVVVHFDSIGSGLMTGKPGQLDSFAIAGRDRQWHWADARIEDNTVIASSPRVAQPVAVRYAWAMNPSQRNLLYNKEGLPASPFRTDDWPLFDPDSDEVIEVNKPEKPDGYEPRDWQRPSMQLKRRRQVANSSRHADDLAPDVTDLNAKDVSYALEAKLPDLDEPFVDTRPSDRQDDCPRPSDDGRP